MNPRTSFLIAGLMALGACSAEPGGASAPDTSARAERAAPAVSKKPAVAVPGPAQIEPEAVARLPAPDFDTLKARLMGQDALSVARMLGEPGFTRRDAPAQIWQYRGKRCVLDLFLYEDAAKASRVRHVELRAKEVARPSDTECLTDIFGKAKPSS